MTNNEHVLRSLILFADGQFSPSAEDNEERVQQLLDWVLSLETDPHSVDEPAAISLDYAKELVSRLR